MNLKNKKHRIYLDFENCLMLKGVGYNQDDASAYWFRGDRKVYAADRITKIRGWERLYVAAITGDELNSLLPDGTLVTKKSQAMYEISLPLEKLSAYGSTESEAKAAFIKRLHKSKLIKL